MLLSSRDRARMRRHIDRACIVISNGHSFGERLVCGFAFRVGGMLVLMRVPTVRVVMPVMIVAQPIAVDMRRRVVFLLLFR